MNAPSTRAACAIVLLLISSCASLQIYEGQQSDTIYFGTGRVSGPPVTDEEWSVFVAEVIVPRFPGFTEWTATGYWKGQREKTHVVQIVHRDRVGEEKLTAIADEYKKRFQQEAVFVVRGRVVAAVK